MRRFSGEAGPGTRVLMLACTISTVVFSVVTYWHLYPFAAEGGSIVPWPSEWMVINPATMSSLRWTALATNGLVAMPTGLTGLVFLGLIIGFFMQNEIKRWWRTHRAALIGVPIGILVVLGIADNVLLPGGFASGLLGALIVLAWLGGALERRWGQRRLLVFSAAVFGVTNLVGALLLWVSPGSLQPLFGSGGALTNGTQPLTSAIMAVHGFAIGRRQLSIIPMTGRQLVWLMVAIGALQALLMGFAAGVMQLVGIGVAWLLITGSWRPRFAIDRVRLYLIDRRLARRRKKITVIDGGRLN